MIYENANVVPDFEPADFQGSVEIENLDIALGKCPSVIVTIEKPKPKIIRFPFLITKLQEYFSDPYIREEIVQQVARKIYEKHPRINVKLILGVIRLSILPLITVMITAVNQIQYYA